MSPGPGHIVADERLALPRPRDVASPEFNAVRRRLAAMVHSEHQREAA
jgi:NitT/TauT family transport system ATP-binding protein